MRKSKPFRPSARLIGTIGEDIIKDMHAAVVELVKNSYDADATEVKIIFERTDDNKLLLTVKDNGHGMTSEVITEKWLVPSTSDKFKRKISPKGRIMQGRKGIGRFAAAILGEKLQLITVADNVETKLNINWNDFTDEKFLDEINIDINSTEASELNSGTVFVIEASTEKLSQWNDKQLEDVIKELRKLLTPIRNTELDVKIDIFNIQVVLKNFESNKFNNNVIKVESLPLIDYYDYRIYGTIFSNHTNNLIYQNKSTGTEETDLDFQFFLNENEEFSADIHVDFRIFDRDNEAIEKLIYEMVDDGEEQLGKNEAKKLLNDISGVSIFRNRFRIRPYGDDGNDWLSLDKKRVQNPTIKIGANQISGIIDIQDEDISRLIEKSARDGLKENSHYNGLVSIINQLLNYVELKRYTFRKKTGKGRKNHIFSSQISQLTNLSDITHKMVTVMKNANVSTKEIDDLSEFISIDIRKKEKIAHELENQIAMYQGQATLGKVTDVVMHEIRKPIQWINNQTKNLERAYKRYLRNQNDEDFRKILRIIRETPGQLEIISNLFTRIESLATRKRTSAFEFSLNDAVQSAINIFSNTFKENEIELDFKAQDNFKFIGWRQDIEVALANILENALYWVSSTPGSKRIEVSLYETEDSVEINIWNNGPKISKDFITEDSLFDPGISGKQTDRGSGTGLGLAISGEAIHRNNGQLKVIEVPEGAKFRISLPLERK